MFLMRTCYWCNIPEAEVAIRCLKAAVSHFLLQGACMTAVQLSEMRLLLLSAARQEAAQF